MNAHLEYARYDKTMGCELIGITEDGRSIRFNVAEIMRATAAKIIVAGRLGEAVEVEVITNTVKPAPSERSDTVEILQAILMITPMVAFDPKDGQGVKQYLRRDAVVSAVIEAGRR